MTRTFHKDGSRPSDYQIFVFGSNLSGRHGAGAALAAARFYGAVEGVAEGLTGRSYALPTVQWAIAGPLTLGEIQLAVRRFIDFAFAHPEMHFLVTRVGCVLAGYSDEEIAPMFQDAPFNCSFAEEWKLYL